MSSNQISKLKGSGDRLQLVAMGLFMQKKTPLNKLLDLDLRSPIGRCQVDLSENPEALPTCWPGGTRKTGKRRSMVQSQAIESPYAEAGSLQPGPIKNLKSP